MNRPEDSDSSDDEHIAKRPKIQSENENKVIVLSSDEDWEADEQFGDLERVRILTWNLLNISDVAKTHDMLYKSFPFDIVVLQEVELGSLSSELLEEFFVVSSPGLSKKGTRLALLTKDEPLSIKFGQYYSGQMIIAEFAKFCVMAICSPFSGEQLEHINNRLNWERVLKNKVSELRQLKPVIIAGDFKVCNSTEDSDAGYEEVEHKGGFSALEKDCFTGLLDLGLKDSFREKNPSVKKFTNLPGELYFPFINHRSSYILVSDSLLEKVTSSDIIEDATIRSIPTVTELIL